VWFVKWNIAGSLTVVIPEIEFGKIAVQVRFTHAMEWAVLK
jgi:hypothetical protein